MKNAQRTTAGHERPTTRGFGALAAGVALVLLLGGCVAAGPSGTAGTAIGTGAPPAAVSPGSASTAVPSAVGTPATPHATATPPPAPTPKPAATPAPTRAPTPQPELKPTPAATAASLVVKQADNGTTLRLAVGQELLLDLGSNLDWAPTVADQNVVSRVIGVLVIQGAQGIYEARAPGTTVLSAIGSPHCTSGVCPLYRVAFQVTITVR